MTLLAWVAGGGGLVAVFAGWREARRKRRTASDRVGLVDWTSVQFAALLAVAVAGLLALRG